MGALDDISVKIRNYKCFAGEAQGFESIKPINLIIGKNNSGKSSLLELIENAITYNPDITSRSPSNDPPGIVYTTRLTKEEIRKVFVENRSTPDIPGKDDFRDFGKYWIGQLFTWEQLTDNRRGPVEIDQPANISKAMPDKYVPQLAHHAVNPLAGLKFKRLHAERDIRPEGDTERGEITGNGLGLTAVVTQFINSVNLPSELVEEKFLAELNKIMVPDAEFVRILVQKDSDNRWEIYLQDKSNKRVSLTNSGSGLQTIILVMAFIYLTPYLEKKESEKPQLGDYIFAFEELENNLHPSLHRRLLLYLRDIAEKEGCHFFLTTHSNVSIDLFSKDEMAQIIHLIHDGRSATARTVNTHVARSDILDDLEFRASDLLQSNGIIWVEGPSDRIYFNRWIELMSDGELREGTDYQCVFYGGRLLAHLSADDPDSDHNDLIKILRVNRNAILIMDSDLKGPEGDITPTKKRMLKELRAIGGFAWVTAGREVENYISKQALSKFYSKKNLRTLAKTESFPKYLNKIKPGEGKRFESNKVRYAARICPHITREGVAETLNLETQVSTAIKHIRVWNGKS